MGSSGTGSFTDYPGSEATRTSGGGIAGGSSGEDRCDKAFATRIEDIERSQYWLKHNTTPPVGSGFDVVHDTRMTAVTDAGETLGFLPTEFNYLAACMAEGRKYRGRVVATAGKPLPMIRVDVAPTN